MNLKFEKKNIENSLDTYLKKSLQAIEMYCDTTHKKLENYAKANRRWTDRTGQARQRLKSGYEKQGIDKYRMFVSHGVDYGIFLEFAHERKYAILEETIRQVGPQVLRGFENLLERVM